MDNLVSLVVFILSTLSVESAIQMKTIKLSKKVIYDCMDIYEQPSLSHPLLKHHIIQMKPSGFDSQSKNKFEDRRQKRIECPFGTVPILRTQKENVIYSQQYPNNHFTFLTAYYPGTHIAGMRTSRKTNYRGVEAGLTGHLMKIGKDQSSSAQTYVATQTNNDSNSIQVGWMINERVFGDTRIWSYGMWLGKKGTGCFNVKCPGFVQVAKDYPLSEPWNFTEGDHILLISIHQDKKTKNWWVSQILPDKSRLDVGYWPKELFNLLENGANTVGFGGIVTSDPRGSSPPMGNGRLPNEQKCAYVIRMNAIDSNYTIIGANLTDLDPLLDSKKCYGVHYIGYVDEEVGVAMSYGGPGGDSCGV